MGFCLSSKSLTQSAHSLVTISFDEQHTGGFVRDYLKGRFFKDMHSPLGKLLYSAVARLRGFHEHFDFASGDMRMFAAACGVGLVPISYLTIKRSGHSTHAAILCAVMVTFE
ncbi:hypothetical protein BGZ68_008879 [Mortierella alpina]|nr:hypothetical protein BGZ68_008879 [Mortierella alpina]